MSGYVEVTVGVVIVTTIVYYRFRRLYRQLAESKAVEESTKQKITFRDGFLIVVLTLAYCYLSFCFLKLIWGSQVSWKEVVIGAPIMWVVGILAAYLHERCKRLFE